MPIWKCSKCHHEWEGTIYTNICEWCGKKGVILQTKSGLENMMASLPELLRRIKKLIIKYPNRGDQDEV